MFRRRGTGNYGSMRTTYNGRTYHSKKEAQYAIELDLRIKAGEVKQWKPQFKLPIVVNGLHICNYITDFWVLLTDGTEEIHEVKGFSTNLFKIKWRLTEALYAKQYKMILIKV